MTEITSSKLSIDLERLPRGPGARVIDVGCGDGRHNAAAALRGCYSVGVDYDMAALRNARTRLGTLRVDLIAADAARLPFRDGVFDAAICTETLEHLPDDAGAMREISRLLRNGGMLLGAVPSHFTEMLYWRLSWGYWHTPGGHVRIYKPRALATVLARSGLAVEDVRYVHFIDSVVWLRFCLTDFLRPRARPATDFEAAVMLAVAIERPVAGWRTRLRDALGRSRFIATLDAAGACVWPKSLTFVARKTAARMPAHTAPKIDARESEAVRAAAGH
jgi:ubiquinone/menaquinone biosynthesis C-methylase UbiE